MLVALGAEAAGGVARPKGQTVLLVKPTVVVQRLVKGKEFPIESRRGK